MNKAIIGFCVMLAFISMPVAFLLNPTLENESFAEAQFLGQDIAQVGELVRFLAEGEIVRWKCLPETSDSEAYGVNNENYVVSFRNPGTYTIVAAIYSENELSIHTQEVTVEGGIILPTPQTPSNVDVELVNKVKGWVVKYQVNTDLALSLSRNFDTVSAEIKDGLVTTPGQIINRTAELNSNLELSDGLMAELQAYLTSQSDMGNLSTPQQHLVVWHSIAAGLQNVAN